MKNSIMKRIWHSEYSGGFNWALVAIFVFVGIFLYNVITATVIIPGKAESKNISIDAKQGHQNNNMNKDKQSPIKLPDSENKLDL